MCGIAGVVRRGDVPITDTEVNSLLCSIEERGTHATGIALMCGKEIQIHKMPIPAWGFVTHDATKGFLKEFLGDAKVALLHTRHATIGSPRRYENNHPLYDGKSAIIHNGCLSNHSFVFNSEKLEPKAETDSDLFRAIFDAKGLTGEAIEVCNKISGSAAIAAVHPDYPNSMLLARSGNPVIMADNEGARKFYFASTMKALSKSTSPWRQGAFGVYFKYRPQLSGHSIMQDHTAYLLKDDDTMQHWPFKISHNFVSPVYRGHDGYAEKMKAFKEDPESAVVVCPNGKCNLNLKKKFASQSWSNLKCHACKTDLSCYAKSEE
jgi:asparagine synthetase B (glutamine-hydrolysing)